MTLLSGGDDADDADDGDNDDGNDGDGDKWWQRHSGGNDMFSDGSGRLRKGGRCYARMAAKEQESAIAERVQQRSESAPAVRVRNCDPRARIRNCTATAVGEHHLLLSLALGIF